MAQPWWKIEYAHNNWPRTNSGSGIKASCAGLWTSSISFDQFIYIRQGMLWSESLCRAITLHRQDNTGTPDRSAHLPAIGWNIELLTSGASPDQDSTDNYPEIGGSTYWNSTEEGHLIIMVAPAGAPSQNS
jgi:hypothetical protein